MTQLVWDEVGERRYETGVDHGVLYPRDDSGNYSLGVAWNGLTTITESPQGATATATYADNIKYLNLISVETFEATINAYTYPDEWATCDGSAEPVDGVALGQQHRNTFGLCYRTRIGNDVDGDDHGYKLHLVWGATAKPSQKAFASVNDQPTAIDFSWDLSTIAVAVTGYKPTASMTINSTKVDGDTLSALQDILYGVEGVAPRLPMPDEIVSMFEGSAPVSVDLAASGNYPTKSSHTITYPTVAHITWMERIDTIDGSGDVTAEGSFAEKAPGTTLLISTQRAVIYAVAASGYRIVGDNDWVFDY